MTKGVSIKVLKYPLVGDLGSLVSVSKVLWF